MPSKPTLKDFLQNPWPNQYIWFGRIECYMRKGMVFIDGEKYRALTIGNITNHMCPENGEFNPNHKPTGLFREFERHLVELARVYGYDGIYVELVLNEFLPDVLTRYGYKRVNIRGVGNLFEYNYWRSLRNE